MSSIIASATLASNADTASIHDIAAGQATAATTHPGISVMLILAGAFCLYRAVDAGERRRLGYIVAFVAALAGAVNLW